MTTRRCAGESQFSGGVGEIKKEQMPTDSRRVCVCVCFFFFSLGECFFFSISLFFFCCGSFDFWPGTKEVFQSIQYKSKEVDPSFLCTSTEVGFLFDVQWNIF